MPLLRTPERDPLSGQKCGYTAAVCIRVQDKAAALWPQMLQPVDRTGDAMLLQHPFCPICLRIRNHCRLTFQHLLTPLQ